MAGQFQPLEILLAGDDGAVRLLQQEIDVEADSLEEAKRLVEEYEFDNSEAREVSSLEWSLDNVRTREEEDAISKKWAESGAILRGAALSGAILRGADLRGADLTGRTPTTTRAEVSGGTIMNAADALLAIQELMDGVEWTPATLDEIANILDRAGYPVRDISEV